MICSWFSLPEGEQTPPAQVRGKNFKILKTFSGYGLSWNTLKVLIFVRINFRAPANCLQIIGINFCAQRPPLYFFLDIQIKMKKFLNFYHFEEETGGFKNCSLHDY